VPGAQVVQAGQRGASPPFRTRRRLELQQSAEANGVPANDIGGGFDFSALAGPAWTVWKCYASRTACCTDPTVCRACQHHDAARGRTRIPQFSYSIDGGQPEHDAQRSVDRARVGPLSITSRVLYFKTDNDTPNNKYKNGTLRREIQSALGHGTDLSGTIRRADTNTEARTRSISTRSQTTRSRTANFNVRRRCGAVTDQRSLADHNPVRVDGAETRSSANPSPTERLSIHSGLAPTTGKNVTIPAPTDIPLPDRRFSDFGQAIRRVHQPHDSSRRLRPTSLSRPDRSHGSGAGRFEKEQGFAVGDGSQTGKRASKKKTAASSERRASRPAAGREWRGG